MAGLGGLVPALRILQYVSPLALIAIFFVATAVAVVRLESSGDEVSPRIRRIIWSGLGLLTLLYLVQAGLIIDNIFYQPGIYGAHAPNIHALSSALAWVVVSTCLLTLESGAWYPYYIAWLWSLASEVVILALSLTIQRPSTGTEFSLIAVQCVQVLLLLFLSAVYFTWVAVKAERNGKDEESTPLLSSTDPSASAVPEASDGADNTGTNKAPGNENKSKGDDDDDDDDEDDDDDDAYDWLKREEKKKAQMKQRLKEEGGWFGYLKSFSIFLPYIWPARSFRLKLHLLGVALCMIAQRILNPLEPRQLGILVDSLSTGDARTAFAALGIYILLNAISSNIGIVRTWLWLPIETNTAARMEKASYNHIMELSCDFHDAKRTGEIFEAMHQGQSVVDLIETVGFTLLPEVADLFIACIYFYCLFDAYMVLIGLATGVLYVCVSAWTTSRSGNRRREMNQARRQKSQIKYDTVNGWKTVSYFNRIPHSKDKFGGAIDHANKVYLAYRQFWNYMYSFQGIIMDLGLFCACTLAVYDIMFQGKQVGRFVTLLNYWGSLTGPMASLSTTSSSLIFDLIDAESLLRIWKKTSSVSDGPNEMMLENGHVKFEGVCFKYEAKKETIEDLSFEAKPGQTVALVGETGAGKSTVLKLLFRFYDVNSGQISIDGQDVRNVTLQSLRENIGVVPQDPTLFNVSIMDNLRYARLDATDEEIYDACKAAAVHDKIMTFSKGYQSKVGERGVKLSGGELQRVAIARAILKNPPIVLLDEATSSVDSETEAKIQDGLKRLCFNRTTFVVAHRLSTVQHADQILVLKDGKILEKGTPEELLEQKGKYYSLWTKQMGIFDPFASKKDKKDRTDGDDSSEGTQVAEIDLIDLQGDLRDPAKKESLDRLIDKKTAIGDREDEETESSNQTKPGLKLDTSQSFPVDGENDATGSSTCSPSRFRPDAPEFVPMSRRQSQLQGGVDEQAVRDSGTIATGDGTYDSVTSRPGTASNNSGHSRGHTRSDPGPTSASSSRPGSRSSGTGPGLLALQQAAQQSSKGDKP